MDLSRIWRYSFNAGEFSGIVLADSEQEAREKVFSCYREWIESEEYKEIHTHNGVVEMDLFTWKWEEDSYFNEQHKDVFELYGD